MSPSASGQLAPTGDVEDRRLQRLTETCASIIVTGTSRRPSGLRKTIGLCNSLAHRTTWLRSDFPHRPSTIVLVWMSPSASGQLAPTGDVEDCRLQRLTETCASIIVAGTAVLATISRTFVPEKEAAALGFNRTAVLLNANTCGVGCRPSATHACIAYFGGRHWRLPPRPRLR